MDFDNPTFGNSHYNFTSPLSSLNLKANIKQEKANINERFLRKKTDFCKYNLFKNPLKPES